MILAILQARVSSTRLPGKVLKPILGEAMLLRQIDRVARAQYIDKLVVATSVDQSDDAIQVLCENNGITCFRGSLDDVLDRFYKAAKAYNPDHVVRLTGDCPLADPTVIDQVIQSHVEQGADYTSNTMEPTFPDGLDVEVMRYTCLQVAWQQAKLPYQREHVTQYVIKNPGQFCIVTVKNNVDLSSLRWTVDEPEDFQLVTAIYQALYPVNPNFLTVDILTLLANEPLLQNMNTNFKRNEGLFKSLRHDGVI